MARFKDHIRQFNKHILNPLMGQLTRLRSGLSPWCTTAAAAAGANIKRQLWPFGRTAAS